MHSPLVGSSCSTEMVTERAFRLCWRLDYVGPEVVKNRTITRMDSEVLDMYGGGNAWYLAVAYDMGSVCPNGNYLETDAMGVGHGICGDTPQVSVLPVGLSGWGDSVATTRVLYESEYSTTSVLGGVPIPTRAVEESVVAP